MDDNTEKPPSGSPRYTPPPFESDPKIKVDPNGHIAAQTPTEY